MFASGSFALSTGDKCEAILETLGDAIRDAVGSPLTEIVAGGFASDYDAAQARDNHHYSFTLDTDGDTEFILSLRSDLDGISAGYTDGLALSLTDWATDWATFFTPLNWDWDGGTDTGEECLIGMNGLTLNASYDASTVYWFLHSDTDDGMLCVVHVNAAGNALHGGGSVWWKYMTTGTLIPGSQMIREMGRPIIAFGYPVGYVDSTGLNLGTDQAAYDGIGAVNDPTWNWWFPFYFDTNVDKDGKVITVNAIISGGGTSGLIIPGPQYLRGIGADDIAFWGTRTLADGKEYRCIAHRASNIALLIANEDMAA